MSVYPIISEGYDSYGSVNLVITEGFSLVVNLIAEASLNIVYVLADVEDRLVYARDPQPELSRLIYSID